MSLIPRDLTQVELRVLTYLNRNRDSKRGITVGQVAGAVKGAATEASDLLEGLRGLNLIGKYDGEHFWFYALTDLGRDYLKSLTKTKKRKAKTTAPEPTLIEKLEELLDSARVHYPSFPDEAVLVAVPRADLQAAIRGLKLREITTGLPPEFLDAWDALRRTLDSIETSNLKTIGEAIDWMIEERTKFGDSIRDTARNA